MISTVIIEDEPKAINLLSSIVNEFCPTLSLDGVAKSVSEGVKLIVELKPDLLFLDIELKDGTSFDILDQLDNSTCKIIFTTAYDNYAIKAFDYNSISYLLKPYSPKDVIKAVAKMQELSQDIGLVRQFKAFLSEEKREIEKISLSTSNGLKILKVKDIIRAEADRAYCTIYLIDNSKVVISKSLKEIEAKLSAKQFLRCHASHLINIDFITKFVKADGGHIELIDSSTVPVSKRKKKEILNLLNF